MRLVATYGAWLDAQAGRGDEVGQVARAWRDAQGRRPRASAYATIARWFAADGGDLVPGMAPERIEAVLTASLAQYHTGNHQAGPAVPSPPLGEDLQVKRLASVPDHQEPDPVTDGHYHDGPPHQEWERHNGHGYHRHLDNGRTVWPHRDQQPDPPADDETAGQEPAVGHGGDPISAYMMVRHRLDQLDERLAGLQELASVIPAVHELLVALIKAMVPVIELAQHVMASDAELESMAGEVRDLAGQMGIIAEDITPAQQAARSVAMQNGWIPAGTGPAPEGWTMDGQGHMTYVQQQPVQAADDRAPVDWAGGLCEVHCREDRCVYGCDCPGHKPDGTHVVQARNQQASQPADQGMRLYGGHVVEPDWARMHDLGEVSDG